MEELLPFLAAILLGVSAGLVLLRIDNLLVKREGRKHRRGRDD